MLDLLQKKPTILDSAQSCKRLSQNDLILSESPRIVAIVPTFRDRL
ncbi:hypothetical protein LEP1GSC188_0454 [Leptospira weilii serovar Topaz str. LT2116]|uniref:Uncharacterized protein n=1 Tax=Leptospira weilii serovar Topaz str. LT2116 TaxID=1088540 RepID=M3H4N6_9LEPT|nr:hypothetical protein LEP1GSC188_0454 [Leptospira weilii serovar Topaz str. LT2116]